MVSVAYGLVDWTTQGHAIQSAKYIEIVLQPHQEQKYLPDLQTREQGVD